MAVLALVAVGGILSLILSGMAKRFAFTRLALILALSPLSLIRFLDDNSNSTVYLYAMIVMLIGITIDGINHLLEPKAQPKISQEPKSESAPKEKTAPAEVDPNVIVWEKAE